MALHAISVKELRQKFPFVRSELKKGESFLIIHKSKPIAELSPVNGTNGNGKMSSDSFDDEKEMIKELERASAEDINKHIPPITKEEYDYYMSLPQAKKTPKTL